MVILLIVAQHQQTTSCPERDENTQLGMGEEELQLFICTTHDSPIKLLPLLSLLSLLLHLPFFLELFQPCQVSTSQLTLQSFT